MSGFVSYREELILEKPIEDWPLCDALIAFNSDGYPLEKVMRYVELRRPFCINELPPQVTLLRRDLVHRTLMQAGLPVPRHIIVNR